MVDWKLIEKSMMEATSQALPFCFLGMSCELIYFFVKNGANKLNVFFFGFAVFLIFIADMKVKIERKRQLEDLYG